jgi:hypothetical protein
LFLFIADKFHIPAILFHKIQICFIERALLNRLSASIYYSPDLRLAQIKTQGQFLNVFAIKEVADFQVAVLTVKGLP